LHWLDLSVIAVYLAATLALGVWLTRRVKDTTDLFLGGRRLPFWAIGMSLVVSDIGALEMVGGTANAYSYGIAQANFEWIGCVPAMIVGGLVFIPLYRRLGIYSIPEFFGQRYGARIQAFLAVVAVVFMAAALGVFFQASASMFGKAFGWSRWTSIAIIASVVTVYTVGGGLSAVVITDVVQCVVLFAGGLVLAFVGLSRVGGLAGLHAGLADLGARTQHHLELLQPIGLVDSEGKPAGLPWLGIVLGLGLVLSPAYWIGNQAIVQRTLGAKNEWHAQASMIFGAALKIIVPVAFVLPGLIAIVLLRERTGLDPNKAYPTLIDELIPVGVGLRGLLYAAFLAALMSSVDSYANSAATIATRDVYRRFLARERDETHYLRVGRGISFAILVLGVAMVPIVDAYTTIYEAFQSYVSYFQGPTLALLIGGVLWSRVTEIGGLACLAGGITTAVVLSIIGVHYLHVAFWSFVVSVVLLVLVSLWRPRS